MTQKTRDITPACQRKEKAINAADKKILKNAKIKTYHIIQMWQQLGPITFICLDLPTFFFVRNVGLPNTKLDAVKTSRFCSMNKPRYINNQRAAHKRYILLNLAIHSQQIKLVLNMCNAFIIHSIQCLLVSSTGVWGQHSSEDEITFCWHTSQWCQPSPNLRSWGDGK